METVTGTVQGISNKNGIYSLGIGEGDNVDWYGFYKTEPQCNKGDTVEVGFTRKGRWLNADPKTLKVVGAGSAPSNATRGSVGGNAQPDNRQASIVMQSSMKTATDIVRLLIDTGAVSVGAAKTAGAKAKAFDIVMDTHAEVTRRLYNRATHPQAFLDSLKADAVEEEVVDADVPADDSIGDTGDSDFQDF